MLDGCPVNLCDIIPEICQDICDNGPQWLCNLICFLDPDFCDGGEDVMLRQNTSADTGVRLVAHATPVAADNRLLAA